MHAQYTTGVGMQRTSSLTDSFAYCANLSKALAATAAQAYYGILHHGAMSGVHSHAVAGLGNYYPNNAQTSAGSVYYYPHPSQDGQQASAIAHAAQAVAAQAQAAQQAAAAQAQAQQNSKKRSFDGVDQFLEDVKRNKLQPVYDGAMAQRLTALSQFIPSTTSEGVDFNGTATVTAPATNGSQPFTLPSLRTKQDLIDADNFLTQLSANVYDSSAHQYQFRHNASQSPHAPNGQNQQQSSQNGQHDGAPPAPMANQPSTQALTPPQSNYTTSHSPVNHQHTPPTVSPQTSAASMYPTLPTAVSSGDINGGYPAPVSSAPTSSLASAFDSAERRRYAVNVLQKAKPADVDMDFGEETETKPDVVSDANIDPSLDTLVVDDKSAVHSEIINALRSYIQELLRAEEKREKEGGDLIVADEPATQQEDGDHAMVDATEVETAVAEAATSDEQQQQTPAPAEENNNDNNKESEHQTDAQALYPILKAVAAC
jgi:hypothetical protein